ncbi:MAG: hypothetical protein ACN6OP_20925 [Pseudomonadales bacterium]
MTLLDTMTEEATKLVKATEGVALWWSMYEAQRECIEEEPYKDDQAVLSFMGSGASTQVTVGELRAVIKTRNSLAELLGLRSASIEGSESNDAGRPE